MASDVAGRRIRTSPGSTVNSLLGRVQLDQTSHGKTGMWKWDVTHLPRVRQYIVPYTGWEETSRGACRRVEKLYLSCWNCMIGQMQPVTDWSRCEPGPHLWRKEGIPNAASLIRKLLWLLTKRWTFHT
jgi:hypothetical protein